MKYLIPLFIFGFCLAVPDRTCHSETHAREMELFWISYQSEHLQNPGIPNDNRDYDEGDLQVLQDIIDLNELDVQPLELGDQTWENDRLTVLALPFTVNNLPESFGNLEYLGWLTVDCNGGLIQLPESIGNLTNLVHLDLY